MGWEPDKQSQLAETNIVEVLRRHYQAVNVQRSRAAEYDVCLTLPYGTRCFCEIKTDFLAAQTQRVYFEIRDTKHNKATGLCITKADIWAHYVPHVQLVWLFDPKALLWYLKVHSHNPVLKIAMSHPGSGDNNSQGYLVPLSFIEQWQWPQQLSVDA